MEASVDEGTRVEAGGDSEESSENVENSSNINFHKENENSIEQSLSIDNSDERLSDGINKEVEDTKKINSEKLSQEDLGTELSTCGHDEIAEDIQKVSDLGKAASNSEHHATVEDASRSSSLSNSNSESSGREINLESLSPNTEESGPSIDACLSEPLQQSSVCKFDPEEPVLHAASAGPSNDREDISEDELDIDSIGSVDQESTQPKDVTPVETEIQGPTNVEVSMELSESRVTDGTLPETQLMNDDTRGTISSDDREIIDLKLEDAVGKSDDDDDFNRESKGASEDLEAVSDDELPEASQVAPTLSEPSSSAMIGDVVSSEDEGALSLENVYGALHDTEHNSVLRISSNLDISEASDSFVSSTDLHRALDKEDSLSQQNSEPLNTNIPSLPPLEAEPISDEEDMEQADDNPSALDGDREAGEIKSPVRSPISEQGGLLGEVEPISADETSDTDGELPSGDDDSRPGESGLKSGNNFESIESDEDGDLEANSSIRHSSRSHSSHMLNVEEKKGCSDYMENISDEENLEQGDGYRKSGKASLRLSEENLQLSNSLNKDIESDKKPLATNFNEHQVELDYEENEGEEGVGKIEELPESKTKDDGEEGELAEAAGSDKDEGELSDDDCEEGEIKEPGSKKPFVTPMCRFFQKGNCTWGINCRFLHPGVNDKGNYQMIEIPGFKPLGIRSRIGVPGQWPQQPEVPIELPPPPIPDIPPVETAWERGLRIAKEQRKKANERKELEPDFEEKCLNLSVDEERELNKENERMPKIIPKDPYYDQQAFEEDEYYKIPRDPWQTGHYENFEVRYHRENSFSPPYRDKTMMMPPSRYSRPYSPPVDKFGRERIERREPFRPEPPPAPITSHDYPSPIKRPDEWTDPWRRSKSPQAHKPKPRNHSRGRRAHRSVSDSSNSSRSSSGSSSGSSRSSHSFSGSSGSSSRSRSPEPAPPGVDRHDHYFSPSRDQPRSAVAVRGRGGYNNYDQNYRRGSRGYDRSRVGNSGYQQRGNYRGGGGGGYYNNYGGGGGGSGGYPERDMRDRGRDDRLGRRGRSPPDRPLPYVRPRPKSASSRSSSSRSRSRSRGRFTSSHSRSSSGSSRSSSSSSSSAGSADSEHLYRDLGPPAKNPRGQPVAKKKRTNSHKEHTKNIPMPPQAGPMMGPPHSPKNLDRIPHPRDPKNVPPGSVPGRNESKYASRNAPQAPIKAKDPLKVVGQKSNIKLTLLPKQQQSSLGNRPNPLDSPPHNKRRLSERDTSPVPAPPAKRLNLPLPQASSALRLATEKASKLQMRQERGKSPPPAPVAQPPLPPNVARTKAPISPQKQPSSSKSRIPEPAVAKAVPKAPSANAPTATATGAKAKKSMSSRREELLKQLKAVEDAIARKKSKLQ